MRCMEAIIIRSSWMKHNTFACSHHALPFCSLPSLCHVVQAKSPPKPNSIAHRPDDPMAFILLETLSSIRCFIVFKTHRSMKVYYFDTFATNPPPLVTQTRHRQAGQQERSSVCWSRFVWDYGLRTEWSHRVWRTNLFYFHAWCRVLFIDLLFFWGGVWIRYHQCRRWLSQSTHSFIYLFSAFVLLAFLRASPPAALIPLLRDLYIVLNLSIHSTGLLFSRG